MTVGTGRNVADGLLFSIDKQNPSLVVFLHTDSSLSTVEKLSKELSRLDVSMDSFELSDENDVQHCFEVGCNIIKRLLKEFSIDDIGADYTSGTKAMSAGLVLAAASFGIKQISYVHGERDSSVGRVISGTEQLRVLKPSVVLEVNLIRQFANLFNNYQFQSALNLVSKYSFTPKYEKTFTFFKCLAEAFDAWDKFDFSKALDVLKSCDKKFLKGKMWNGIVEKSKQWLYRLKQLKENDVCENDDFIDLVVELVENAKRRKEQGVYDDAVARCYRALELIFQIEYGKVFGKRTEVGLVETIEEIGERDPGNNKVNVFLSRKDKAFGLLYVRNHSILAHGIDTVKERSLTDFLTLIETFLPEYQYSYFKKIDVIDFI